MVIRYFSKTHIPSHSANSIQVVNMVNSFSKYAEKICLYIPFKLKRFILNKFKIIFYRYGMPYPSNLNIYFLDKDKKDLFEKSAIEYIKKNIKDDKDIFFTRSIEIAYFLAKEQRKFIYESHVFSKDQKFKNFKKFIDELNNYRKGKIVAISDYILEQYINMGLNLQNIKVFPDGINDNFFNMSFINSSGIIGRLFKDDNIYDKKIVLYTGSLKREKGVFFILSLAKIASHLNFVVIGGTESQVKYIKNISSDLGLNNFYIHSYVPYKDIPCYIADANIVIMPYLKKGDFIESMSPLKMFEYLASGKIVLASNLNSVNKILKHKVNSFLFEPEDCKDCLEKIEEIFSLSSEEVRILSNNAIETAKKYTWNRRVKNILEWYNKSCG